MNVGVVELLCRMGVVTKWVDGEAGIDTYVHMPYHYEIDGVTVEFLPHWGYYSVGNVHFDVRTTEEEVRNDLSAVKALLA